MRSILGIICGLGISCGWGSFAVLYSTRCRRDKKVPNVWSGENNMDPMAVPEILSNMSDAEQMLIARLAPTVHVHLLKHGGIA